VVEEVVRTPLQLPVVLAVEELVVTMLQLMRQMLQITPAVVAEVAERVVVTDQVMVVQVL
tara:strand:- start:174 stop:353 length:180 start_codon:yes stop_codon:yes gene_type:complete